MLSLFLMQQGCTTSPLKPWAPHVTEEVRATIRTIGVAVGEQLPRQTVLDRYGEAHHSLDVALAEEPLRVPVKSLSETASYARRTAEKWSKNWLTWTGDLFVEFPKAGEGAVFLTTIAGAMLVVTPVVGGAGAVAGAIEAPRTKEKQVHGVLRIDDLIHRLQRHVITHLTERTDMSGPPLPRTANDPVGDRETVSASGVSQPDAMLKIQLKSIDLRGAPDIDPLLALNLDVQAILEVPTAATPLYRHSFHYVTGARRFTEWTAEGAQSFDAQVFHETLDLSLARLAELMVDDLFLTYPFVHEHRRVTHGP
jgi:hypothetical protein